jgi:hypothetical protein
MPAAGTLMTALKPVSEIMTPDPRYHALVTVNETGEWLRMQLADHYAMVAEIEISAAAPVRPGRSLIGGVMRSSMLGSTTN